MFLLTEHPEVFDYDILFIKEQDFAFFKNPFIVMLNCALSVI